MRNDSKTIEGGVGASDHDFNNTDMDLKDWVNLSVDVDIEVSGNDSSNVVELLDVVESSVEQAIEEFEPER